MAADEAQDEAKLDASVEATIEPFLDMRDPTFRRILRAATSKFNQMICPLMASVCVRDLCMFWNDHSKSCYIVDTLNAIATQSGAEARFLAPLPLRGAS